MRQGPKPDKVWAFCVPDNTDGIREEVLDMMHEQCEEWTGWGFLDSQAWLLFDLKSDAMYAKMMLGDGK